MWYINSVRASKGGVMSYKPTVYEQIATDILDGKTIAYKNYEQELTMRGWDENYFNAYVK